MNMGQALNSLGHGCYSWRKDVQAVKAMTCVLDRIPQPPPCHPRKAYQAPKVMTTAILKRHSNTAYKFLCALRRSGRNGASMTMGQLCELLGIQPERYRTALRVLNALCETGMARRNGKHQHAAYWAE